MRRSQRRMGTLLLILIASTPFQEGWGQEKPPAKRSGVFKVSGVLLYKGGKALSEAHVAVAPLVPGEKPGVFAAEMTVRVEKGEIRVGAGDGNSDQKGRFEIIVRREEFHGPRILFAVLVATSPITKMEEIKDAATRKPQAFQIGEKEPAIDLGRIIVE